MSSRLIAACMKIDGSNISTDYEPDGNDEKPLQEGVRNTAGGVMHAASDEAISHKNEATSHKRKRQSRDADDGKAAKISKVEMAFQPAAAPAKFLRCIFVDEEVIPLWPQYLHRACPGNFIRFGTREPWLTNFMAASRKSFLRGYEPQDRGEKDKVEKDKAFSRVLVKSVCNKLSLELRRVLCEARKEHRRVHSSSRKRSPGVVTIKMHHCEVNASDHARVLYILADDSAVNWIHKGLHQAVKAYLEVELRAISHIQSPSDSGKHFPMHCNNNGVRDKIHWMPDKSAWGVKFDGMVGDDKRYSEENGLNLSVSLSYGNDKYKEMRMNAFHDACMVWNAVDQSGKKRVQRYPRPLNVQMLPVCFTRIEEVSDAPGDEGDVLCGEQELRT